MKQQPDTVEALERRMLALMTAPPRDLFELWDEAERFMHWRRALGFDLCIKRAEVTPAAQEEQR